MNEFKKRIEGLKSKYELRLAGGRSQEQLLEDSVSRHDVLEIVEEMTKEFPTPTEITQAFTMISNLFPESHGFSKRHLEKFLIQLREAIVKWFMEVADEE